MLLINLLKLAGTGAIAGNLGGGSGDGESNRKGCPLAFFGTHVDMAAHVVDKFFSHREAQAGTFRAFRGEKWNKDTGKDFGRNPASSVFNDDHDIIFLIDPSTHRNGAARLTGLG